MTKAAFERRQAADGKSGLVPRSGHCFGWRWFVRRSVGRLVGRSVRRSVRRFIPLMALLPAWAVAGADYQWAEVVGVDPVYETVRRIEPVEECREQRMSRRSGGYSSTPPILGAIIGAAIGNAVGHKKTNKGVGAVAGAILGGSIGADIGRSNRQGGHSVETVCDLVEEVREEERLAGYHVRYQYNGAVYATRMRSHPGERIRVRVRVTPVS